MGFTATKFTANQSQCFTAGHIRGLAGFRRLRYTQLRQVLFGTVMLPRTAHIAADRNSFLCSRRRARRFAQPTEFLPAVGTDAESYRRTRSEEQLPSGSEILKSVLHIQK